MRGQSRTMSFIEANTSACIRMPINYLMGAFIVAPFLVWWGDMWDAAVIPWLDIHLILYDEFKWPVAWIFITILFHISSVCTAYATRRFFEGRTRRAAVMSVPKFSIAEGYIK